MPPRVKVTALLTARPGRAEELTNLLLGMAPLCRAEPGNLRWDIWQDQTRPDRYVLDELYVDDSAVAAHRDTAHYKDYLQVQRHVSLQAPNTGTDTDMKAARMHENGKPAVLENISVPQIQPDETCHGSYWGNDVDLSEVVELAARGQIRHTIKPFKFEQLNEYLDPMRQGEIVGRAVMTF